MASGELQAQLDALKRRHPLGELVEALGVRLHGQGRVRQGAVRSTTMRILASRCTRTASGSTALDAGLAGMSWSSWRGRRG